MTLVYLIAMISSIDPYQQFSTILTFIHPANYFHTGCGRFAVRFSCIFLLHFFDLFCYTLSHSAIAQLVERLAVNEDVPGSSPGRGADESGDVYSLSISKSKQTEFIQYLLPVAVGPSSKT